MRINASRMAYEAERVALFGAITASYTLVGSLFASPIRILVLQNNSNSAISYSLDGINTLITLQPGISIVLDIMANRSNMGEGLSAPINEGFYVKAFAGLPGSGNASMSAIYGYAQSFL